VSFDHHKLCTRIFQQKLRDAEAALNELKKAEQKAELQEKSSIATEKKTTAAIKAAEAKLAELKKADLKK